MKTGREGKGKRTEPPKNFNGSTGSIGVNKCSKRISAQGRKAAGKNEPFLVEEDELPSKTGKVSCQQLPDKGVCFPETKRGSPVLKLGLGQTLVPSSKIKLQLFPIDEGTRIGLERDGHHPYLELTLRARKKISSVLKHINSKWGSSSVALGEPKLFPYHAWLENMGGYRTWSLNDCGISAADVYAAIGSPSVFRLRYGWFSNELKTSGTSFTSTPSGTYSKPEGAQQDYSSNMENLYGKEKQIESARNEFKTSNISQGENMAAVDLSINPVVDGVRMDNGLAQTSDIWADSLMNISIGALLSEASLHAKFSSNVGEVYTPTNINEMATASVAKKMHLDVPVNPEDNEMAVDSGFARPSTLWDDSLTNISIGGLLSEASLQGKFDKCNPKTYKNSSDLHPSQLISDSFDAFIAGQMEQPQGPRPSSHVVHSSILDAEETCHAFPFQKFSSSGKDFLALGGSNSGVCSPHAGSKSFKIPKFVEVSSQTSLPQDHASQESKTDAVVCPGRAYADDSSLGLSGIKWTDSLGPFDLGLSSSRKIINGDSVSLSGFVR